MLRIDSADNVASLPTAAAAGTPGYFRQSSDPMQTTVTNDWANGVQEELMAIILAAGITPSKTTLTQVAQSLQSSTLNLATTTNSGNAYSITYTIPPVLIGGNYITGSIFRAKINAANTGAATLAINGGSAKNIKLTNGLNVVANHLPANWYAEFLYDGTNLILLNPAPVAFIASIAGSQSIATGTHKFTSGTENVDPYGMWNNGAQKLVVPLDGEYRLTCHGAITLAGGAFRSIATYYVNGSEQLRFFEFNVGSAQDWQTEGSYRASFSAGDQIELYFRADTNSYTVEAYLDLEYMGS